MVDDSHAVGFLGENGRGTHEHHKVMGRVDIITGTLGKALGGASGGYTSGRKEIIELLRQRSRPYLFSNTVAPAVVGASLKILELLARSGELRQRLRSNTEFFRERMAALGFHILPGEHPITPLMLGDATLAAKMAERLLQKGSLRGGIFIPRGAAGEGADPHSGFRGAQPGRLGICRCAVRRRARRAGITPCGVTLRPRGSRSHSDLKGRLPPSEHDF